MPQNLCKTKEKDSDAGGCRQIKDVHSTNNHDENTERHRMNFNSMKQQTTYEKGQLRLTQRVTLETWKLDLNLKAKN